MPAAWLWPLAYGMNHSVFTFRMKLDQTTGLPPVGRQVDHQLSVQCDAHYIFCFNGPGSWGHSQSRLEERQEVELFPLVPAPAGLSGETDGQRPTESSEGGKVCM